ncbi:MAG TPA: benzoate-CoA ligase family protein [Blastocatellia bacterium]|nr:benzoate-CoA ligase family protein [Blastocatellia bacterium]
MIQFPERFNMAEYFLDHNLAAGRGDKVCLRFGEERWTYAEVVKQSNRAGHLLHELGARVEDRVLFAMPDCPQFVALWFGAAKIGAVIAMVNPLLPAEDYAYYLDYTRAKVFVVHETLVESLRPILAEAKYLKNVLVVGDESQEFPHYETLAPQMLDELETAGTHRDDPAIWLFTSGSTGKPKAAVHLQHDLPYNTECYAKQILRMREDDVTVAVPKLFFGYATGTNLLFPFAVGAETALFNERSTPEKLFEVIERRRPTVLTNVPTMINAMLNAPGASERDLSSLRVCVSAGEALPPELYRRWKETFGVEILDGVGSAEMFHIYISNRFDDVREGCLGRIVPGYEAEIIGPDGQSLPDGQMGTLRIKGDSAAICYWQAHEKSKETFAGDYCTTGDQFTRDAEGYFWYGGRTDEMLKVSGVFVSPTEVENCLLGHEAVRECAVVGFQDGDGLTKTSAYVALNEGFAESDDLARQLQEFVKGRLAMHKYPRRIIFRDGLPKNDRGKIDRKNLK